MATAAASTHHKPTKTSTTKLPRVPGRHREYFTSNLASLAKAGLPVTWALQTLEDNTDSKPLKLAIQQMRHDIDEGSSFWKALERSGLVSPETLMLTRIGEESGNLPENLRLAAQQEEKQRLFRAKIRTAMMYPSFVMGTTLVVGFGISWFLLPRLAQTFTSLGVKLPLVSRLILGFGTFLQHY
ncbi:MAG TPA: type II secretion system F family protein, partial [Candidatus Saccharimonadia bacterium]